MKTPEDITRLLHAMDAGDASAHERLMQAVYEDLERIASGHLRKRFGARAGQLTLEPGALVNESYLRLIRQRKGFDNRGQFFSIATKVMLRVLADYRRGAARLKRGEHLRVGLSVDLVDAAGAESTAIIDAETLGAIFDELDRLDPRTAEIAKMRVVWNMTVPEVAEALDISPSSVDRGWRFAKAWIGEELARRK
ncbi:MAG: sigma-70 family RNA polymerase sigma factor [Phycisphaerae bacterium]|nr:sigma-70 family RNA polymerase sigma factor [Phycisphaerae bacterium]